MDDVACPGSFHMRTLIITAMLIITATIASAENVVKLRLSTSNGFAPLSVRLTATVEPHAENRMLCWTWDSPDGESGRTCQQLEGENNAKTISRTVRFGTGEYVVAATVVRVHDGKPSYHMDKQTLNVLEPGTPFVR